MPMFTVTGEETQVTQIQREVRVEAANELMAVLAAAGEFRPDAVITGVRSARGRAPQNGDTVKTLPAKKRRRRKAVKKKGVKKTTTKRAPAKKRMGARV